MAIPGKQRTKDLETMIALAGALLAVHLLSGRRLPAFLAFLLLFTAAALPGLAARIAGIWSAFSGFIGRAAGRILLTGVYYLVLTPAALLSRLFTGDTLGLKKAPAGSGWHERNKIYSREDLEKAW